MQTGMAARCMKGPGVIIRAESTFSESQASDALFGDHDLSNQEVKI